jgi:hypothetical protein
MLMLSLDAMAQDSIARVSLASAERKRGDAVARAARDLRLRKSMEQAEKVHERAIYLHGYVDCMQGRQP